MQKILERSSSFRLTLQQTERSLDRKSKVLVWYKKRLRAWLSSNMLQRWVLFSPFFVNVLKSYTLGMLKDIFKKQTGYSTKLNIHIGCYFFIYGVCFVLLTKRFTVVLRNIIANHRKCEVFVFIVFLDHERYSMTSSSKRTGKKVTA